jgi:hypothetical protein
MRNIELDVRLNIEIFALRSPPLFWDKKPVTNSERRLKVNRRSHETWPTASAAARMESATLGARLRHARQLSEPSPADRDDKRKKRRNRSSNGRIGRPSSDPDLGCRRFLRGLRLYSGSLTRRFFLQLGGLTRHF